MTITRLSKKAISRFQAFNRKGRIQDTIAEMDFIQDNLYDTLMNVGGISQEQRMTVLKNLVAQVKKANSQEVIQNEVNLNESEKAKDVLRNIMLPLI